MRVLSAHRNPTEVVELVSSAREHGYVAFICGAGMAAHLAGVVAAHTTLPVVGVPLSGGALNGVDALYATVQMPKGIPVATVAIDGSLNAALLVVEMLAISDADLAERWPRTAPNAPDRTPVASAAWRLGRRAARAAVTPDGGAARGRLADQRAEQSERDALAGAAEVVVQPGQRVLLLGSAPASGGHEVVERARSRPAAPRGGPVASPAPLLVAVA